MNFLAHALLADAAPTPGDAAALVVGGVIGDWIKGSLPGLLPDDLAQGVALHRAIDSFAETNPAFCASRARILAPRRRYAGVLVDMFYDHLLARDWATLHPQPLAEYCATVYQSMRARWSDIPTNAQPALKLMIEEDWLASYATIEGLADILTRMAHRARQPNPLAGGEQELLSAATGFEADFYAWLPAARHHAQHYVRQQA